MVDHCEGEGVRSLDVLYCVACVCVCVCVGLSTDHHLEVHVHLSKYISFNSSLLGITKRNVVYILYCTMNRHNNQALLVHKTDIQFIVRKENMGYIYGHYRE